MANSPLVGRVPGGGADRPVAVTEALPALPTTLSDIKVGVVDTGLVLDGPNQPHPWFGDHVSYGADDSDPLQVGLGAGDFGRLARADGHGTFVTGLILREAPRARVVMRGVLDRVTEIDGHDSPATLGPDQDVLVADAVRSLARDPDVQVINLSFGGGVFAGKDAATNLEQVLREIDPRIAVVAAAGNDGKDAEVWPAAFPGVTAVGALEPPVPWQTTTTPLRAAFSNYGRWVTAYAVGVRVLGPFVHFDASGDLSQPPQQYRGWARWSGTSFAAATVSGRIAQTCIELRITGAEARQLVLDEARAAADSDLVWVRGAS